MAYFHVVVEKESMSVRTFLYGDLSRHELKRRFIKPYLLAQAVLKGNEVIELRDVKRVWVIETTENLESTLKQLQKTSNVAIDRINSNNEGFLIISAGSGWREEDILQCGQDVTSQFIDSPPGVGTLGSHIVSFINNPWAYGVGVALLIAIATAAAKSLVS